MPDPNLDKDDFYLEIDIKESFGFDAADSPALAESIVGDVINYIQNRTSDGKDARDKKFSKGTYSTEYANTLEFKVYGKTRRNVNLQLTGSMLNTIDVVQRNGNEYRIGWNDRTQNRKAYNHHTGDTVPKRPWFKVSNKELEEIKKEYQTEIDIVKKQAQPPESEELSQILDRVFTLDTFGEVTAAANVQAEALSNAQLLSEVFSEVLFDD